MNKKKSPKPLRPNQIEVLEYLADGLSIKEAGARAGVAVPTIYNWRLTENFKEAEKNGLPTKRIMRGKPDISPVSFKEFVESPEYLNKANTLWPVVMEEAEEIIEGTYAECLCVGSIGAGKTTIAIYVLLFQVYCLSCIRNPQAQFGLDSSSAIVFAVQNRTKDLAVGNDFNTLREIVLSSPYFTRKFPPDKSNRQKLKFPYRIEVMPASGDPLALLGLNIYAGLLDEVNFFNVVDRSRKSVDGMEFDAAAECMRT